MAIRSVSDRLHSVFVRHPHHIMRCPRSARKFIIKTKSLITRRCKQSKPVTRLLITRDTSNYNKTQIMRSKVELLDISS